MTISNYVSPPLIVGASLAAEPLRAWFPEGKDDPQVALLNVHPEKGEYLDSPYSTLIHLYGYAKAALTGSSPTEVSDQKKINLR
jgi:hypothetical protein